MNGDAPYTSSIHSSERVNVLRDLMQDDSRITTTHKKSSSAISSHSQRRRKSSVRFDAAAINLKESKKKTDRSSDQVNPSGRLNSTERKNSVERSIYFDRSKLSQRTVSKNAWRIELERFLRENRLWETFLCLVAVCQFILLSVETEHRYRPSIPHLKIDEYCPGAWIYLSNLGFTAVSFAEVGLWLVGSPETYLSSGANRFNLATCICSALTDLLGVVLLGSGDRRQFGVAAVRDVIQVCGNLRIFRLWRSFGRQWGSHIVVRGLLFALSALGRVAVLGFIFLYVFANVAARMFSTTTALEMGFRWGSLTDSLFSLFLMLTFDGWSELAMDTEDNHPESPAFFVIFIWTIGIVLLSIVTSVMVQAYIDSSRALRADELYRQEIQRESNLLRSYYSLLGDRTQVSIDEVAADPATISLMKRFGAIKVTAKQMASACTLIGAEEGSGRQFYKTHVEAQTLQEKLHRKLEELERAAHETDHMVFELVNKLKEIWTPDTFRKQGSTLAPLRSIPDLRQISSDERSFLTHVASQGSNFFS